MNAGIWMRWGSVVVHDQWNYSSSFLPYTGEPIEFRLEEREQPIHGVFADGVFHSRWADYAQGLVGSWRILDSELSALPIAAPASTRRSFSGIVNRMKSIIFPVPRNDLMMPPPDEATTFSTATTALPRNRAIKRRINSNQISS